MRSAVRKRVMMPRPSGALDNHRGQRSIACGQCAGLFGLVASPKWKRWKLSAARDTDVMTTTLWKKVERRGEKRPKTKRTKRSSLKRPATVNGAPAARCKGVRMQIRWRVTEKVKRALADWCPLRREAGDTRST